MNKWQLIQTLREMGIDYPPASTKKDLLEILEGDNQNRWLRSAAGMVVKINKRSKSNYNNLNRTDLKLLRTTYVNSVFKKPSIHESDNSSASCRIDEKHKQSDTSISAELSPESKRSSHSTEVPIFDPTKDLGNYALKRASGICDLCESSVENTGQKLKVFLFTDQPDRPHTIKNVVALCPDCYSKIECDGLVRQIRILKRKARKRINANLEISFRNQESFLKINSQTKKMTTK